MQRASGNKIADFPVGADFHEIAPDGISQFGHVPCFFSGQRLAGGPHFQTVDCDEAGGGTVGDVIERIRGVVCPVHDLAFDGFQLIAQRAWWGVGGPRGAAGHEIQVPGLIGVDKMMQRLWDVGLQSFIFQHGIQ